MTSAFEGIFNAEKAKTEWKPCPFCGAKNEMTGGLSSATNQLRAQEIPVLLGTFHMIRCSRCNCNGPMTSNEEDAVKAWNGRR